MRKLSVTRTARGAYVPESFGAEGRRPGVHVHRAFNAGGTHGRVPVRLS